MFRVDRIQAITVSREPAREVQDTGEVAPMAVTLGSTGRSVVVDLPEGSAVLERHPVSRRWALPEGLVRAELPVGDHRWARRLILASAGTVVLREPQWLVDEVLAAARASRQQHSSTAANQHSSTQHSSEFVARVTSE
jgi:predicted DNA-binding transcriptional regulator YafY